jgi:hypothetical protein
MQPGGNGYLRKRQEGENGLAVQLMNGIEEGSNKSKVMLRWAETHDKTHDRQQWMDSKTD